jgi:hypothetical protein
MITTGRGSRIKLRRFAVLRVMLRPRSAARLLAALARQSTDRDTAISVIIEACALFHYSR